MQQSAGATHAAGRGGSNDRNTVNSARGGRLTAALIDWLCRPNRRVIGIARAGLARAIRDVPATPVVRVTDDTWETCGPAVVFDTTDVR